MFLLVQLYDVLDHYHLRVHMVETEQNGGPGATMIRLNAEIPEQPEVKTPADFLAFLGEELMDLAHSANPLL